MRRAWQWWLPWFWFGSSTVLIAWPWFREPGWLFLLDFVWAPQVPLPQAPWQVGYLSLPWEWLWWALSRLIETSLVQKVAFALPWLLSGVGMYHLARWLAARCAAPPPRLVMLAALTAGTFYATNPFVFTRAVMGQYYLLLAYALTPWALLAWLRFFDRPTVRMGLAAGLIAAAVMLANAHHLLLLPLLLLFFIRRPRAGEARAWVVGLAPLMIVSFLSLLALLSSTGRPIAFDPRGPWARALQAPDSGNLLIDTLTLTATWKTDLPFLLPHESLPAFSVVTLGLLLIMGAGLMPGHRGRTGRFLRQRLTLLMLMSIGLAIGVAHPVTGPFAAWLYAHVPGWIGLRDSAKFLSLLAVAEAALLSLGITALSPMLGRLVSPHAAVAFAGSSLALTLYAGSPFLTGLGGQIFPLPYPQSWYEWRERVSGEAVPAISLFLPWHQYLPFAFTADRNVTNPAPGFFGQALVIAGDNSEVGGNGSRPFIYSESHRPLSQRFETILAAAPSRTDFGARVASEKIRYVMLATDTWDTNEYHYLYQQPELKLVFEGPELVVWENSAYRQ